MPRRLPVATRRLVSSRSSRDGDGSPDGWLWQLCAADRYVVVLGSAGRFSGALSLRGHITRPVFGSSLRDALCGEVTVPWEKATSGDLLPAAGRLQDEADVDAETREHVNQAIGAEQIDPPS